MMKYIGKNHNAWHRVALMLENALDRSDPTTPCIGVGGLLVNGALGANGQVPGQVAPTSLPNQKNTRGLYSNTS